MNITFSSTFTLLQHEVALMEGCLSIGLTALRNATVSDKRKFYSGFFNTSIAFERLMKLIVVVDHMLSNNFDPPTKKQLKTYGHDLSQLYQLSVDAANRNKITGITMPIKGSIEEGILRFLSEFAKSSRYYNAASICFLIFFSGTSSSITRLITSSHPISGSTFCNDLEFKALFKETLVDYMLNDAEIKRKKRWP
jgi:hypothetical protein